MSTSREQLLSVVTVDSESTLTEQNEHNLRLLALQLAPLYMGTPPVQAAISNYANTQNAIGSAIDKLDVGYHTFLRLWEVFGNVWLNQANSDSDRQDSSFNQITQARPEIATLSALPFIIGFAIHYHQVNNQRHRQTILYQMAQYQALTRSNAEAVDEARYRKIMQDLLARGKVTLPHAQKIAEPAVRAPSRAKKYTPSFFPSWNDFKADIKEIWNFLTQSALIFWPTWMIAVMIVGFTASYAFPVLLFIILATFAVSSVLYGTFKYLKKRQEKREKLLSPEELKNLKNTQAEVAHLTPRLLQRANMKLVHGKFKKLFAPADNQQPAHEKHTVKRVATPYAVGVMKQDHVVVLLKTKQSEAAPVMTTAQTECKYEDMVTTLEQAKVGKHILNGKHTRRTHLAFTGIIIAINNYTLAAFVWWLVGSTLLTLSFVTGLTPVLVGITIGAGFLGNLALGNLLPAISTICSALFGIVQGKQAVNALAKKEREFVATAYAQLSKPYEVNNKKWLKEIRGCDADTPVSCQEAFDYFYAQVEEKKAAIADGLKKKQQELSKQSKKTLSEQDSYILNLRLKDINVYNDRFFRTQELSSSVGTKIKKVAFRLYKLINAAQTWIFVTRSLFLYGAALGAFCLLFGPASPFVFIAIATTMAIAGLTIRCIQMHLDKKANNQKAFIENFDDRISYLKKQYKELSTLEVHLSAQTHSTTAEVQLRTCANSERPTHHVANAAIQPAIGNLNRDHSVGPLFSEISKAGQSAVGREQPHQLIIATP